MAQQVQSDPFDTLSVGDRLAQTREAKGMSLDDIAAQTRIPVRHLQHIEREEWDALPAVTYAVGFTRAYANAVGLDGAELGREVRDRLGGVRSRAAAPEYYQPADPARVPPRSLALIAAVIAVVLIVGYLIWRSSLGGDEQPSASITLPPASAPPAAPRQAAPTPPPQPQAVAGQPVTLTATGPVWLRVSDGGTTLMERTMAAGETYQVPATAAHPVLRVGAPEALRVTVGQTVLPPLGPAGQPVGNVSLRPEDLVARQSAQPAAPGAQPPTQ